MSQSLRRAGRVAAFLAIALVTYVPGALLLGAVAPFLAALITASLWVALPFMFAVALVDSRSLRLALAVVFGFGVVAPAAMAAGIAPFRAIVRAIYDYVLPGRVPAWAAPPELDLALAAAALAFIGVVLFREGSWLARVRRQIEALPTSKVRSAAIGLAEFEGVLRTAQGAAVPPSTEPGPAPFYLEDDTGRILVDPRGAVAARGQFSHPWVKDQLTEVALPKQAGQPVCVVGTVEPNPAAPPGASGPDALIVRRRQRALSWWQRLKRELGAAIYDEKKAHTDWDVFLVFSATERGVRELIRQCARRTVLYAGAVALACLWMAATRLAAI